MKRNLFHGLKALSLLMILMTLFGCPNTTETPPAVSLTELKMAADTITLKCGAGETLALRAIPAEASLEGVVWSSGDETVLTVSGGKITTLKTGTAEVKAVSADGAVSAACTVTVTPAALILFGTAVRYGSSLGDKIAIEAKLSEDANRPADVTDMHPFLSYFYAEPDGPSEEYTPAAMPEKFGYDPSLPILAPDRFTVIADNWADLLDGTIKVSLAAARIFPYSSGEDTYWWSGTENDGTMSENNTAGNWGTDGNSPFVAAGHTENSSQWINSNDPGIMSWAQCYLLGVGVSTLPIRAEAPPLFSLVYNSNGGEGEVPIDGGEYDIGTKVLIKAAGGLCGAEIRHGIRQRFLGWSADPSASEPDFLPGDEATFTDAVTLYAVYTGDDGVIRKVGPAGGLVFYDAGSNMSWGRYLEAASEDISSRQYWAEGSSAVSGEDREQIGGGELNTADLVKRADCHAAHACNNLSTVWNGQSFSDWFLPSRYELKEACWQLQGVKYDAGAFTNPAVPAPLGNFKPEHYWSSTENGSQGRYCSFENGTEGVTSKSTNKWVRPVRAF